MNAMLNVGVRWAVERDPGDHSDLERIEEHGCMQGADPDQIELTTVSCFISLLLKVFQILVKFTN